MAVKTTGVTMTFTDSGGATWNKSLSGFDANNINTAAAAKDVATAYARIVDGTLSGAKFIETTPIAVDD